MVKHGYKGHADSIPNGLAIGAITAIGATLAFAAGITKLIDAQIMRWDSIGYGISVLIIGASFLGALTACVRIKRRYALVCLTEGLVYFGSLLSISALFFGGQYEGVFVTGGLVAAGSGCAYLLKLSQNREGNRSFSGKHFVKLYKK